MECYNKDQETPGGQAYGAVDDQGDFWALKIKVEQEEINI